MSQALVEDPPGRDGLAAWASIERFCQDDRQLPADRRDRIGNVAFRTDWGRAGIENGGERQVFRGASGLRGESRSLEDHECVGCDAEAGVMMESPPASPLEMGEAEFALQFLIVAFDAPAQFDCVN